MARQKKTENVPLGDRVLLSVNEASAYFGIGINYLEELLRAPGCPYVMRVGKCGRKMVKRAAFEQYIANNLTM